MKTLLSFLVMMVGVTSSCAAFAKICYMSDAYYDPQPAGHSNALANEEDENRHYFPFFETKKLDLADNGNSAMISTAFFRVHLALNKDTNSLTYMFEEIDLNKPDQYIPEPIQVLKDADSIEDADEFHSKPIEISGAKFRAEVRCP
jgi:hypothetical protein